MVAYPHRQHLNLPLAPTGAGALAIAIALVFALLPAGILENLAMDSGIAALVPAAEPPLGATARAALVLVGGGGTGLVAWLALFLAVGTRTITLFDRPGVPVADDAPVLRRADAHPDAPARRPLFASRDLGTPFLDVKAPSHVVIDQPAAVEQPLVATVERALPADLDMPLAAFDPQAIPDAPIDWFPKPVEIKSETRPQVFEPSERFEAFELRPAVVAGTVEHVRAARTDQDASASINALLDRLELGVGRRERPAAPPAPPPARDSLQESLAALRWLATQVA